MKASFAQGRNEKSDDFSTFLENIVTLTIVTFHFPAFIHESHKKNWAISSPLHVIAALDLLLHLLELLKTF